MVKDDEVVTVKTGLFLMQICSYTDPSCDSNLFMRRKIYDTREKPNPSGTTGLYPC